MMSMIDVYIVLNLLISTCEKISNDIQLSAECRDLLQGLLQRDPNQRTSFEQLFEHPFIVDRISSRMKQAVIVFDLFSYVQYQYSS
jgi:serine/threonine protein kinase